MSSGDEWSRKEIPVIIFTPIITTSTGKFIAVEKLIDNRVILYRLAQTLWKLVSLNDNVLIHDNTMFNTQ